MANSPLSTTNHAQPDPKRPVAALANSSLKSSKLPNLLAIASPKSPVGVPLHLVKELPRIKNGWHVHRHYS